MSKKLLKELTKKEIIITKCLLDFQDKTDFVIFILNKGLRLHIQV